MSDIYVSGRAEFARGLSLVAEPLAFILVAPGYVPDLDNDKTQADIDTEYQLDEETIQGKTIDGDLHFLADDTTFYNLAAGDEIGGVVLIRDTGEVGTSPLIAYFDGPDFPIASNGEPFVVQGSLVDGILAF